MIDAHVHLWQIDRRACTWPGPDLRALYRDFTADDLWPVSARTGVGRVVQDQGADWYDDPACDPGGAALAERRLAGRYPTLTLVIDHAAKPVDGVASPDWQKGMRRFATLPNVSCKLSGLMTELTADRPAAIADSSMDLLTRTFGYDRLIWGSDWPVVTTRCSYTDWLALTRDVIPGGARAAVFGGNAARIDRLAA